ncbi:MAG: hypothetical protein J6W03_08090 [Bacteroidaceae bacterium]|nr:hypothetical protein [Bacteroidaceae bacterium]
MAKEIITIGPLGGNSYWECNEPFGIVKRYIQLYINGEKASAQRSAFDSHNEWLEGVERVRSLASIINDYWYKTEPLYLDQKDAFDTPKIQNILIALSGWDFFIKGRYPNAVISSKHGWPGFPHKVDFDGRTIVCDEACLDFAKGTFKLDGWYKETRETASYYCSLSYIEKTLIKKLLRAYFLNNIDFISKFLQKLSFHAYSNLSDYMKNGFLKLE